jgi:hypothetical protein
MLGAYAQRRFKNPFVPIRLLRVSILQLRRGDFCNNIGTKRPIRDVRYSAAIEGKTDLAGC